MAGEWPVVDLPTLADFQEGPGILAVDFRETGVPLVRLKGIEGTFATLAGCNYLDPEKVKQRWNHFRLESGDLLISTSASLGRVSEVADDTAGAIAYTGIIRFRPKNVITKKFLRVLLGSHDFKRQAEAMASGSVIRHFGPSHLREMRFQLPPLYVQEAVGEVAAALDDKIELNRRMGETLEAIAHALFKSWFVHFDPVHAKAEGRRTSLPRDISTLFPDAFGEAGLPLGWSSSVVGELFDVSGGNTPSTTERENWDGPHEWVTPKDLSGLAYPILLQTERRITDLGLSRSSSGLLPPGSLLLSSRAPIGYMAFTSQPVAINQGFAGFVSRGVSTAYAWGWCFENMPLIKANASGSTFPEISKSALRRLPMLRPSGAILSAFEGAVSPIIDGLVAAATQSRTLAGLRDTLLPKLITGELRIRDAERKIAAA